MSTDWEAPHMDPDTHPDNTLVIADPDALDAALDGFEPPDYGPQDDEEATP